MAQEVEQVIHQPYMMIEKSHQLFRVFRCLLKINSDSHSCFLAACVLTAALTAPLDAASRSPVMNDKSINTASLVSICQSLHRLSSYVVFH